MAKNKIADLSLTPTSNSDALGQSTAGSANANTLDAIVQNMLTMLALFYDEIGGVGTVGGTADAITLATNGTYPFQSLATGLLVAFKAGSANTGAATINVDTLGAKAIRRQGDSALSAGDIAANGVYLLRYDTAYNSAAGAWILLNAETALRYLALAGGTLTGALVAAVGTTSLAPLKFQSGTSLTTAEAGALEFDGKAFYASAAASSRQVIDTQQFVCAASAVSLSNSSTSAQNIFTSANDVLTVQASTAYAFELLIRITTGGTSSAKSLSFGGTATLTSIGYVREIFYGPTGSLDNAKRTWGTSASAGSSGASTDQDYVFWVKGTMRINGGGTIIPQVTFSAGPGGTCQTEPNSYFRLWPLGADTVAAVGNWA